MKKLGIYVCFDFIWKVSSPIFSNLTPLGKIVVLDKSGWLEKHAHQKCQLLRASHLVFGAKTKGSFARKKVVSSIKICNALCRHAWPDFGLEISLSVMYVR